MNSSFITSRLDTIQGLVEGEKFQDALPIGQAIRSECEHWSMPSRRPAKSDGSDDSLDPMYSEILPEVEQVIDLLKAEDRDAVLELITEIRETISLSSL